MDTSTRNTFKSGGGRVRKRLQGVINHALTKRVRTPAYYSDDDSTDDESWDFTLEDITMMGETAYQ